MQYSWFRRPGLVIIISKSNYLINFEANQALGHEKLDTEQLTRQPQIGGWVWFPVETFFFCCGWHKVNLARPQVRSGDECLRVMARL